MTSFRLRGSLIVVASSWMLLSGCSEKIVEAQTRLGGSCLGCHEGITDVHPAFALACVDCHGGNDAVVLPATVNVRDQKILTKSHVLPLDSEMWWANGMDDNGDGRVDEQGEFFDGRTVDQDGNGGLAEGRLAKRGQLDSEMNRDVNYLRFLNPGDLRAAQVGCGNKNRNANAAMVCHAEVVYDLRRSIMTTQAGVIAGANYGNSQLPKAIDFRDIAGSDVGARFDARNPRIGRVGYAFNYDVVDDAFSPVFADPARNIVTGGGFDRDLLLDSARANQDPSDDLFEVTAAPLFDDGTDPLDPGPGLTRTGQRLAFFDANVTNDNRSVEVLQNIGNAAFRSFPPDGSAVELRLQKMLGLNRDQRVVNAFDDQPITNPVDAALRVFRAYHIMNTVSPADNFGFVDFTTSPNADDPPPNDPNDIELRNKNNPIGRFRPSGCSSCHVTYAPDGHNQEPIDRTVADNGRQPETALPFGIRTDLGQRPYAQLHLIKRTVDNNNCKNCHGFVTRVDFAVNANYEHETDFTNLEGIATIGPFEFQTPALANQASSCVNIFDNLAHYKNGSILNEGEGLGEDKNNNGLLDEGEDANNNACLDIPDREPRSRSFDGRQPRIVYGGGNGAVRLYDVHIEVGMNCVDCHYFSRHGDGNIYTRNYDAEPLECDDCHGTPYARANLKTSGPNGGDLMSDAVFRTAFGKPWFEERDGKIIQRSRVIADLEWEVPQLVDETTTDPRTAAGLYAHTQPLETGPDIADEARPFAHIQETGKKGGLECYSCHSSWQPNCLTCHMKMDVAKPTQEIWFGDDDVEDVFFQLFSYTRSPFYLGRGGDVEGNKITTHRSLMQLHFSVAAGGQTVLDNLMFSTANNLSSMVSNPYFPHTVRTTETKSCARCHTLELDLTIGGQPVAAIASDHFITEATAQGTGRYMNVADWALVATSEGFDQLDIKKEAVGTNVFPGFDLQDVGIVRKVPFAIGSASDVLIVRGVSFANGSGDITDVAVLAHAGGLSFVDVVGRDFLTYPPTELARVESLGPVLSIDHLDPGAAQSTRVVAVTNEELCTVDFRPALSFANIEAILDPEDPLNPPGPTAIVGDACLPHGLDRPTRVRLHGRFALVTHARGLALFVLDDSDSGVEADPGTALGNVADFPTASPALDVTSSGRFAYVATGEGGVEIFDIGPVVYPLFLEGGDAQQLSTAPVGTALVGLAGGADSRGVALYGTRLLVADGRNGLRIIDVAVPADPRLEETVLLGGGAPINEAASVVVATVPTRSYALVADGSHGLRAINITSPRDFREQLAAAADDPDALRGFRLSFERWDPMTPKDPKNVNRQILTFPTSGDARVVARGLSLDALADKSGRRMRDGWQIGANTLDERIVARMRSVITKEVPVTADIRGDGLGCVVRVGDEQQVATDPADPNRCMPIQSRAP